MKEKKMDLRTRQTYSFLTTALFELLKTQSFSEISVTDICEKAMVHRTTFYKHFEDKEHLLRTVILEFQKKFDEYCNQHLSSSDEPKTFYLLLFKRVLEYIAENKILMSKTIFDKGNNYVEEVFKASITEYLKNHFKLNEKKNNVKFKISPALLAEYYTSASIAMANWWLENDMSVSIDDMVKYLDTIVSGNIVENF